MCHYRQMEQHRKCLYCFEAFLNETRVLLELLSYPTRKIRYYRCVILRFQLISIIFVWPEAPCHENSLKRGSTNVPNVVYFFWPVWLLTSNYAATGHYRWTVTKYRSSPKFRGHDLTSQETRKANICHICQLHKLASLRATRGDQTLVKSSQTFMKEKLYSRCKSVPLLYLWCWCNWF